MLLLYYDEVKYDPPKQKSYWLGGICLPHEIAPEIETLVSDIAEKAFGSRILAKETEFHGIDLCRGKGNLKGKPFEDRMEYLSSLIDILSREDIHLVKVKINPENITHSAKQPADIAFMFLVETAEELFQREGQLGMMFGDYDEPVIGSSVAQLSQFRKGGTGWERAKEINSIIDTVHFAKSHHSRLIQLADIYLYCCQFMMGDNSAPWRAAIARTIVSGDIYWRSVGRDWPSEARWYR